MCVICHFSPDVQTLVEKPYLHMIGRSSASSEDQLKYTKDRVIELMSGLSAVKFDGRDYVAVPRIFAGIINTMYERWCTSAAFASQTL